MGEEHAVSRLFDRRQPLANGVEHVSRRRILAAGRIGLRHLEHAQEARRAIGRASTRLLKLAPSAEPPALTPPASSFLSSRSCSCAIVVVSIRRGRFVLTGLAPEDLVLTDAQCARDAATLGWCRFRPAVDDSRDAALRNAGTRREADLTAPRADDGDLQRQVGGHRQRVRAGNIFADTRGGGF